MHFKSIEICSHTVAVANINGDLSAYVAHVSNIKGHPDLFHLSKHGMPPGAGKKGGQLPRSKSKRTAIPLRTTSLQPATSLSSGRLPPELTPSSGHPSAMPTTASGHPSAMPTPSSSHPSAMPGHPPAVQQFPSHLWGPLPLWTPPSLQPPRMWTPGHTLLSPPPVFTFIFRKGNISVCYGCKGNFANISGVVVSAVLYHCSFFTCS